MGVVKNIEGVKYPNKYYWDKNINPNATISNGLADCTTLVYGAILQAGLPAPVSIISSARNWHKYLINGWYAMPYEEYKANIKVGDVLEWVDSNHVAIVSNVNDLYVSGSFYTGVNGKSTIDGKYDTREGINTLKELNDFMLNNYEYRYFHYVPLETECSWCGGFPTFVLVCPNAITPVARNKAINQVYVGINGLRVRSEANTNATINGSAQIGFYNVEEVVNGGVFADGNTWYKIGEYYIAGVKGVAYYPKEEPSPATEIMNLIAKMQDANNTLEAENKELKERLSKIRDLT